MSQCEGRGGREARKHRKAQLCPSFQTMVPLAYQILAKGEPLPMVTVTPMGLGKNYHQRDRTMSQRAEALGVTKRISLFECALFLLEEPNPPEERPKIHRGPRPSPYLGVAQNSARQHAFCPRFHLQGGRTPFWSKNTTQSIPI